MRYWFGFICVLALGAVGCAEPSGAAGNGGSAGNGGTVGRACQDECTDGDSRCEGSTVQSCLQGVDGCFAWEESDSCLPNELCLDIPDAHCDGDFYARFTEDGARQNELRVLVRSMVDPRTSPPEDHPEAQWANPDGTLSLILQLPRDVSAVATYYLSDDTLATYFAGGTVYTPHRQDAELVITVTEWEGEGGVAAGTFECIMHSPVGAGTNLTDGEWRAPIIAWE